MDFGSYECTVYAVAYATHLVVADVLAVGPEHVEVDHAALRFLAPVRRVRVHPEHRKSVAVARARHPVVQVRGQPERAARHRAHRAGQRAQRVQSVADRHHGQEVHSAVLEPASARMTFLLYSLHFTIFFLNVGT